MIDKFKVGDRVNLTEKCYNDSPNLEHEYKMKRSDVFVVERLDRHTFGIRYARTHNEIGYFDNYSAELVSKRVIVII